MMGGDRPTAPPPQAMPTWERRLVIGADRAIYWMTRHWALVFNGLFLAIVGLAIASPLLRAAGMDDLGRLIFGAYRVMCHQLPERSFFIHGYQVAFCQRDVGVQLGLLLGGVAYAASSGKVRLRSVTLYALVFVLPVAIDGLSQLFGLRSSVWPLRLGTGLLFGIGTTLLAYPYFDAAMRDTRRELESRFGPGLIKLRH